jgi:hypothetical protein
MVAKKRITRIGDSYYSKITPNVAVREFELLIRLLTRAIAAGAARIEKVRCQNGKNE